MLANGLTAVEAFEVSDKVAYANDCQGKWYRYNTIGRVARAEMHTTERNQKVS